MSSSITKRLDSHLFDCKGLIFSALFSCVTSEQCVLWHTDWHVMKDFRMRDLNLITYLDNASRCVTGYGVFKEATGLNAVEVLRQAILAFGTPASIL